MEEGRPGGRGKLTARQHPLGHGPRGGSGGGRTPWLLASLAAAVVATAASDAHQPHVLMLWGGVTPDGELRLDPAFVMDAPEKLPSAPGPYRLEVVGAGGTTLLSLDFEMDEISDGSGGFLFMAPFREQWRGALDRIVLTGPAGTATLDRETRRPMAIVIDRASGQIRAILRGAAAEARIAAAAEQREADAAEVIETSDGTRVLVSYGLPGSGSH